MKYFCGKASLKIPVQEGAAFSNLITALVAVISLLFSAGSLVALPGESTELSEYSQIAIGDTIKGVLEPIDGRLSSGQFVDRFIFEATEGQELLISLASYDFDPFLWLLDAKGKVLTIDDDSGDALGAVISGFTVPETGMYTVRVSSYGDSETGEYTFIISEIPLIDNPFSILIGQGINGELSLNDPQFSSGQLYDVYSFEASPDRPIFISMISDFFDPNLWLFTKEGRVLSANDNIGSIESEGTTQSLITFLPPTEDIFTIIASSRGSTELGTYTLALDTGPAPVIVRGERLAGTLFRRLESSDFQLDMGQYLDVYDFQGERNETVSVTLVSADFDSYLVILDQTGKILASDDDSGLGSDALVTDLLLPADGRYYAWVYSVFAGERGDYMLELSKAGENGGEIPLKKAVDPEEGMTLMMKRKSMPLGQLPDILGLDFNPKMMLDITKEEEDKPFTDADRCKGSSAPYEAKVKICVSTRPGYTGPGTGFPFDVTIYVEGFTDSTEMNDDGGITITPPAIVTKPIPAPGECVTFAKWVIITENASAGAKSIRAIATESGGGDPYGTEAEIGRDSEVMNVVALEIIETDGIRKGGDDIAIETIVGERISLSYNTNPEGITLFGFLWDIPGKAIADFKVNDSVDNSTGKVSPLTNLTEPKVEFTWVDGGDNRKVRLATLLRLMPPEICLQSVTYNVRRPKLGINTKVEGMILVDSGNYIGAGPNTPAGHFSLHFGGGNNNIPGISFFRTPEDFRGGDTQWVQLVTTFREIRIPDPGKPDITAVSFGLGLDTTYPYSSKPDCDDSPGWVLGDPKNPIFIEASVDDNFDMWLMFRPDENGIWIPMSKVSWHWAARAKWGSNVWRLISGERSITHADRDTTEYPEWDQNVKEIEFVEQEK